MLKKMGLFPAYQLSDFSERAVLEFGSLARRLPKWFATFQKSLNNWRENSSPSDWLKLEAQDPAGNLKKIHFEKVIKTLFRSYTV